jgi:hypothetical protein
MVRKIIGTALLLIGGLIAAILFTYGGPVFPHISGPIVLGAIGTFLLVYKRKVA